MTPFRRISAAFRVAMALVAVAVIASAAQHDAQAQRAAKTLKVLFIGNSYTFYHNLPDLVAAISRSKKGGPVIEGTLAASANKNLSWHLANGPAVPALEKGGWDFVNLQETSLLPGGTNIPGKFKIGDPAQPGGFYDSVREWVKRVRAKGATPVLERTWARQEGARGMHEDLIKAFAGIGEELNVKVIPVGDAWEEAKWRKRTVVYYHHDGSHPSEAGSYLTACTVYAAITGQSPEGAPGTLMGYPTKSLENAVVDTTRMVPLVDLPQATATELQRIAWDVVSASAKSSSTAAR
jgi:hypothetical protein